MTNKSHYTVTEAAEVLGYGHIESFRRACRSGWLKDRLHPVPGRDVEGFHHNSLAYPIHEVDLAAGF